MLEACSYLVIILRPKFFKILKNITIACLLFLFGTNLAIAGPPATIPLPDEGMWLPLYLKKLNERDMKNEGMRLNADDIYNINKSSLKDAVVCLNKGMCTAEIVSAEGLMLTNHHCGYDKIAEHSSVENNYLKDGFWAKTKADELPNPGFTASILVFMEDETAFINNAVKDVKTDDVKQVRISLIKDSIAKAASDGDKYRAEVKEYYDGNEYYLVVYQDFTDVRLVGAPPSSIGKFGGDVDNWMWPRHTGDFSVFRIYTGRDGKPAPYSKDNIPYKPKYFFPVSLKGEKQNDFAMVMGYPGHTSRYLTTSDLEFNRDNSNPAVISTYETELQVMKKDMDADEAVKIKLASEYASLSNTYKYFLGQELLLKHGAGFDIKSKDEKGFTEWVEKDETRKKTYGKVLSDIREQNNNMKALEPALTLFFRGIFNAGVLKYTFNYFSFNKYTADKAPRPSRAELDTLAKSIKPAADAYFGNTITTATDKKVFVAFLVQIYKDIPAENRPDFLTKIVADNKKAASPEIAISEYVDYLYKKSFMLDKEKAYAFLDRPKLNKIKKDPMYEFMGDLVGYIRAKKLFALYQAANNALDDGHKLYMQGLREWKADKTFYPDANSTLRVTYGKVLPYFPRDAVYYKYYTTYDGILEKYNPKDPEFFVPQREIDLLRKKEFGRYAQNDTLRINFLANTDITGGNSGSPVLNADGNLIGLAFDGDWESMIGDLSFNPATNRTICVDIRYVLWVMDIYAGAGHLIKEMQIVE
jgi:hypothetical protein